MIYFNFYDSNLYQIDLASAVDLLKNGAVKFYKF